MAERNNDKGLITWIMTIINLCLGLGFAITTLAWLISTVIDFDVKNEYFWTSLVIVIVWALFSWYWIKRSIMIILGKGANTWVYVGVSFIMSALIGGTLMLIAKILN